ncbi:hypothetical protein Y032_0011g1455 [Ancylostoma ceylanicum]|uniref:Uncharacterized protein n=1 Tax=Ancylostoma ceylanicum TaxID=53326 RepID=A0A016VER7_9BILA|nr:hypothetical protein Y032_0011g1455 [Ancylostoma ceylanicum]
MDADPQLARFLQQLQSETQRQKFTEQLDTRLRVIQGFKIQSVGHDEAKDLFVLTCARFHHTCSCKFECEWGRVDSEGREDTAPFCYIMTHTQNSFSAD